MVSGGLLMDSGEMGGGRQWLQWWSEMFPGDSWWWYGDKGGGDW